MEENNKKIFLAILSATIFVVALVWIATAPEGASTLTQATSTPVKAVPVKRHAKPEVLSPLKRPTIPTPIKDTSIGIPPLKIEKPISTLTMPDIIPPATGTKHVDPRIAATVLTSGDTFDRLVSGALSLFVSIMTH